MSVQTLSLTPLRFHALSISTLRLDQECAYLAQVALNAIIFMQPILQPVQVATILRLLTGSVNLAPMVTCALQMQSLL